MFVERVALNEVPVYARIGSAVLDGVLSELAREPRAFARRLDASFREMELRQPCLAELIANEVAELRSPALRELGFFLGVLVFRAFEAAFGARVSNVELRDVTSMLDRLVVDGELRSEGAGGRSYSEDAIAVGQPALMVALREEIDHALRGEPDAEWEGLDALYETLLVMVLVLTHAVRPEPRPADHSS